jgi:hypothetical protein
MVVHVDLACLLCAVVDAAAAAALRTALRDSVRVKAERDSCTPALNAATLHNKSSSAMHLSIASISLNYLIARSGSVSKLFTRSISIFWKITWPLHLRCVLKQQQEGAQPCRPHSRAACIDLSAAEVAAPCLGILSSPASCRSCTA